MAAQARQRAHDVFDAPVAAMRTFVVAHAAVAVTAIAAGLPPPPPFVSLLGSAFAPMAAAVAAAQDAAGGLRRLRAMTALSRPGALDATSTSAFFGVHHHRQSDAWDVQFPAGSPLAALIRHALGRPHPSLGLVVSELTGARLVDGAVAWLTGEFAWCFVPWYEHGFLNALVLGAAVRALFEAGLTGMAHFEALLDIDLPFPAQHKSRVYDVLPDHGRGRAIRRGLPGALPRGRRVTQAERPLTEQGVPYTEERMIAEGLPM